MIIRWKARRAMRRTDKAVVVTALLAYVGPLTFTRLQQYIGGSVSDLMTVLIRLEGCGRVESDWIDGPHPRQRLYRIGA